jgi:hypothetical protein
MALGQLSLVENYVRNMGSSAALYFFLAVWPL